MCGCDYTVQRKIVVSIGFGETAKSGTGLKFLDVEFGRVCRTANF